MNSHKPKKFFTLAEIIIALEDVQNGLNLKPEVFEAVEMALLDRLKGSRDKTTIVEPSLRGRSKHD